MPCNCDGYSTSRGMDPSEAWKSLSRHHQALERETELLRIVVREQRQQIEKVKAMFPGIAIESPEIPAQTPDWRGETYRDANGEFPSDIREHLDWLSKQDYK